MVERYEILIRISPELARLLRLLAAKDEVSRNEWIERALIKEATIRKGEIRDAIPQLIR